MTDGWIHFERFIVLFNTHTRKKNRNQPSPNTHTHTMLCFIVFFALFPHFHFSVWRIHKTDEFQPLATFTHFNSSYWPDLHTILPNEIYLFIFHFSFFFFDFFLPNKSLDCWMVVIFSEDLHSVPFRSICVNIFFYLLWCGEYVVCQWKFNQQTKAKTHENKRDE